MVASSAFKIINAAVIMMNFALIIATTDFKMSNLRQEETTTMAVIGYFFTSYYVVELVLKMKAEGRDFWFGHDMIWNAFDSAIVYVAVIEIIIEQSGARVFNTSFLRILRFFKLSRVIRMFSAMRTFKEIRIMLDSLCGCVTLFMFSLMLLALFLSVFAVFFVQGAAGFLEHADHVDLDQVASLNNSFGSVSVAMLSLFQVLTGGVDWGDVHAIVKTLGTFYEALFIMFVAFFYFAFMNVVTATFCEKALSLATPTTSELIQNRLNKEFHDACELMGLLTDIAEDDGSRKINKARFEKFVLHPEVEIYFQVRGLKATSARRFFNTLCDVNDSDSVPFADFVSACVKLDGFASSIDMHCQSVRQMLCNHKVTVLHRELHLETKELHRELHTETKEMHRTMNDRIFNFGLDIQELKRLLKFSGTHPKDMSVKSGPQMSL